MTLMIALLLATLAATGSVQPTTAPATQPAAQPSTQPAPQLDLPYGVQIVSRDEWGAEPAKADMLIAHVPDKITIHHTAVMQNPDRPNREKLASLQEFSQSDGKLADGRDKIAWADIPYHYYICDDGEIFEARDVRYEGDSNTNYDLTGHALIVLEGNFEEEEVTPEQLRSVKALVAALADYYDVPAERITGHKDQAQTACPGKDLYEKLDEIREVADEPVDDFAK